MRKGALEKSISLEVVIVKLHQGAAPALTRQHVHTTVPAYSRPPAKTATTRLSFGAPRPRFRRSSDSTQWPNSRTGPPHCGHGLDPASEPTPSSTTSSETTNDPVMAPVLPRPPAAAPAVEEAAAPPPVSISRRLRQAPETARRGRIDDVV